MTARSGCQDAGADPAGSTTGHSVATAVTGCSVLGPTQVRLANDDERETTGKALP
jgi:hypothetical protein